MLQEYLAGAGETALQRAYEIAREAMGSGVGVLEMAAIHHEAMRRVMPVRVSSQEAARTMKAAELFFVECLSPFEMTHRAFRESNAALRRLNERLEEEAQRIAHALHSEAEQLVASIHLALDRVAQGLPAETRGRLSEVTTLLDKMSEALRHLSHELRPTILDDLGLMPALRFLAEGASARSKIPVAVAGRLPRRLSPAIETAIYRIAQEALNNLVKHAKATTAHVEVVKEDRRVRCSIRDDGAGFNVAGVLAGDGGGGLGLVGIRERLNAVGGTLQIASAPGQGTDLLITIPTEE